MTSIEHLTIGESGRGEIIVAKTADTEAARRNARRGCMKWLVGAGLAVAGAVGTWGMWHRETYNDAGSAIAEGGEAEANRQRTKLSLSEMKKQVEAAVQSGDRNELLKLRKQLKETVARFQKHDAARMVDLSENIFDTLPRGQMRKDAESAVRDMRAFVERGQAHALLGDVCLALGDEEEAYDQYIRTITCAVNAKGAGVEQHPEYAWWDRTSELEKLLEQREKNFKKQMYRQEEFLKTPEGKRKTTDAFQRFISDKTK